MGVSIRNVKPDIGVAIRVYHENIEFGNSEIKEIFGGNIGSGTLQKLKKAAFEQMLTDGVHSWNATRVNSVSAFKAWGLDITDLEKRYDRLLKFTRKQEEVAKVKSEVV